MAHAFSAGQMTDDIRAIYSSAPSRAAGLIEIYLHERWNQLSLAEKLAHLEKLTSEFDNGVMCASPPDGVEDDIIPEFFSLLLGKRVDQVDFSSPEFCERLVESLNTIFDTLNRLVNLINTTLFGRDTGQETIRKAICVDLETENQGKSLESYLGQINNAFLTTLETFKGTASAMVEKILEEIDPTRMSRESRGGLRLGPLRKAELFEIYEEKYGRCRKWFDSGRFMEEFLREFERNCRRSTGG